MAGKKDIKLVKLEGACAVRYNFGGDGTVTIYGENGKELTNERINWLLDKAKDRVRGIRRD